MSRDAPNIIDQAIAWHLRQADMAATEWEAFVAWLEVPVHAEAYDRVTLLDRQIAEVRFPDPAPLPVAANDDAPRHRRWWPLAGGGAIAAALVLGLTMPSVFAPAAADHVYATRDGERRDVRLADGTQVALNGGSLLRVSGDDPRRVALDSGEALFHVVHDAAHPFELRAGNQVVRDLGTTFNVVHSGARIAVAVAEGSVLFQPDGAQLRLGAGQAVTMAADHRLVRSTLPTAVIGGWRTGDLSFDGTPVGEVAASLRRALGIDLRIIGDLSKRPFTGMIHVTGAADRDVPHLADLIGATWRRNGEGWVLAQRDAATP
ncbi:FecR family protein [Sphingomonas kyungheensis]|uniref:FecR domain-containing protein n=1 Tax=Sphingomonas kyungheensis TaxID=1069987 RepID=A0ABU8H192_9SPHN